MKDKTPFLEEQISENVFIRTFSENVSDSVLKWHWDMEDRVIHVLENKDWQFQMDNKIPVKMEGTFIIEKGVWHRIIKGSGDLRIKIEKIYEEPKGI